MNFADLEAFVAVAECGSVNRAALRLRLTQPATTRRIQNFEAAMGGVALLDRSSKPPVLTPAGRQALDYSRRVLAAVGELRACTADTATPTGELRLGIAHGLTEIVMSSPIDDLRLRFPQLQLRASSHWTKSLIEGVQGGGLDCAVALVTEFQTISGGLPANRVGQEQVVIVGAKTFKAQARGRRLRLRDLGQAGWVVNTLGCGYREALQRAFDRAQTMMRISGEIIGYDLQLSLIARGVGLGLVPLRKLNASPLRRQLRVVPVEDFALTAEAIMLHRPALGSLKIAVDALQKSVATGLQAHNPKAR